MLQTGRRERGRRRERREKWGKVGGTKGKQGGQQALVLQQVVKFIGQPLYLFEFLLIWGGSNLFKNIRWGAPG